MFERLALTLWEGSRQPRRSRPRRLGRIVGVVFVGGLLFVILFREQQRLGTRLTRAALLDAARSVDAYMADHDGGCPEDLETAATHAGLKNVPQDAWSRPFRLRCPGARGESAYELWSDGPDGLPGGLDRIE